MNVLILRDLPLLSHERDFLGLKFHNLPQRRRQRLPRQLADSVVKALDSALVADDEQIKSAVHPHMDKLLLTCAIVARISQGAEPGVDEPVDELAHFVTGSA